MFLQMIYLLESGTLELFVAEVLSMLDTIEAAPIVYKLALTLEELGYHITVGNKGLWLLVVCAIYLHVFHEIVRIIYLPCHGVTRVLRVCP